MAVNGGGNADEGNHQCRCCHTAGNRAAQAALSFADDRRAAAFKEAGDDQRQQQHAENVEIIDDKHQYGRGNHRNDKADNHRIRAVAKEQRHVKRGLGAGDNLRGNPLKRRDNLADEQPHPVEHHQQSGGKFQPGINRHKKQRLAFRSFTIAG